MKRDHQSLLTVLLPFILPENSDNGEPESLLDEVEFAEHEVDVEEDQHVAAAKLVSVLGNKQYKETVQVHISIVFVSATV